jgi:spore maturation protein CgeB
VKPPKVLLTGADSFHDLLAFCERGLREAGADVRVLVTNRASWFGRVEQLRWRVGVLPGVGSHLAGCIQRRCYAKLSSMVLNQLTVLTDGWKPDLLLSILGWSERIAAEVLTALHSIAKVGWLMDDPFLHNGSLVEIARLCDHLYVVDRTWIEPIRLVIDRPTTLLPCGADLATHHPIPREEVPPDRSGRIVFVGSSYYGQVAGLVRRVLLEEVADLGLCIYGDSGWQRYGNGQSPLTACYRGGELTSPDANLVYNGADIALNIHHPQFRWGTSLRTFGLAASGACQLVDWRPGLDEYFIPDEEIAVYDTAAGMREQTLRYLNDHDARKRLARAGYERVCREHTYAHRIVKILKDAEILRYGGSELDRRC